MYKVNDLDRDVLITEEEVIFHGPTAHTIDPRIIRQAIIIAEERFVRPALGSDFYEALIASKNTLVTSGNLAAQQALIDEDNDNVTLEEGQRVNALETMSAANQTLWKTILWKYCAECVLIIATPEAYLQFTSDGIVHKAAPSGPLNASGTVAPDLKTVKWFMDKKMMDRIDPLHQAMHLFLCNNIDDYDDYEKPCDCDESGTPYKRKSDIILGIYDEEDGLTNNNDLCCGDNAW